MFVCWSLLSRTVLALSLSLFRLVASSGRRPDHSLKCLLQRVCHAYLLQPAMHMQTTGAVRARVGSDRMLKRTLAYAARVDKGSGSVSVRVCNASCTTSIAHGLGCMHRALASVGRSGVGGCGCF